MRKAEKDPYTVAVTPIAHTEGRWYHVGRCARATCCSADRRPRSVARSASFPKGAVVLRDALSRCGGAAIQPSHSSRRSWSNGRSPSAAKGRSRSGGLEMGLKQMAASGAYGIHAEINVTPSERTKDLPGEVYSDIAYPSPKVHDERPGAFANPIHRQPHYRRRPSDARDAGMRGQSKRGGTFAFCDTDSLAIHCGDRCPEGIPCSPGKRDRRRSSSAFDALNPYDPDDIVPHLLKVEYPEYPDLRCFAVSAKRYVLYPLATGQSDPDRQGIGKRIWARSSGDRAMNRRRSSHGAFGFRS